ncbi:RNA polymerase sigma factor [Paraclostridium sp. AKS46]|nr:RNA polymerase sigma factor [Paraclostridium sp. AKS46]
MAQSDEELIKEILKGNESAMEVLVKRYYDMVHSFVYRNVNDYNIAYDITQESFIKMMKNIDKYKLKEGNFKSWLLKIALNTTKDYFKSKIYNQRKRSDDISNYEIEDKTNVIDILSKKKRLLR